MRRVKENNLLTKFNITMKDAAKVIGIMGLIGMSLLGAIHLAFLFPQFALPLFIAAFLVVLVVHAFSFTHYISTGSSLKKKAQNKKENTSWTAFLKKLAPYRDWLQGLGLIFSLLEVPIKFSGVYIGFIVIAKTLPFTIPFTALIVLGVFFGITAGLASFLLHTNALGSLVEKLDKIDSLTGKSDLKKKSQNILARRPKKITVFLKKKSQNILARRPKKITVLWQTQGQARKLSESCSSRTSSSEEDKATERPTQT